MRRYFARLNQQMSEGDVESGWYNNEFQGVQVDPIYPGYPEEMFVTETADEFIPYPSPPKPRNAAKPSGIVQHQLSGFLNQFTAIISQKNSIYT